jgi:L-aspartate oxidase
VVSRAIFSHLQKTSDDPARAHVYLDMRAIAPEKIRHRFPNIIQVCQQWGIDVFSQPIPVAPAAHYWMGGIATDLNCQTSIEGLYAIGETASTGVHGANRLASNSLLECIVFAAQLSQIEIASRPSPEESFFLVDEQGDWEEEMKTIEQVRQKLPSLMWQSAGISRSQEILEGAIAQVSSWREEISRGAIAQGAAASPIARYLLKLPLDECVTLRSPLVEKQLRLGAQTMNLLDIGYLILKSAAFRTESRGGHYRSDYPQTSPDWQVHTLVKGETWQSTSLQAGVLK